MKAKMPGEDTEQILAALASLAVDAGPTLAPVSLE
jgi:hypothetical protein